MADSKLNELSLITTPTMSSPLYTVESNSDKRMLIKDISQVIGDENIAPAYDATETYSEGDLRMREGKLYQANQDIDTPEQFDATKWDEIKVTELSSGGGASVIQLTQAEYTALTTAEKMNGSIYKLTDKALIYCLDEEYHAVKELTSAQYEALTTAQQNNGTIYIQTDAETTADDIPYSAGVSVADKLDSLNNMFKSGTSSIASPRISINNQSGTYYRVGNIVTAKITIVFNSDGQNSGAYFNTFALDGVSKGTSKLMGFMGVDNDLYELETLNNDSAWVYKNGTRINASNLNGKTAYLTIHATL